MGLVVLLLSAACSGSSTTASKTATTAATSANSTAASVATTSAAATQTSASTVYTLKWASQNQVTTPPVIYSYRFIDTVEKNSNGRVKFDRFPGSVLGTDAETCKLLTAGSIDMATVFGTSYGTDMILYNYPTFQLTGNQDSLEFNHKIRYEIPETSAILEAQTAAMNVKFLNCMASGANGVISRVEATSLYDLKGKKLGSNRLAKEFQQFGIDVQSMNLSEIYESLSRGVIDAASMSISPMVALKWYEGGKSLMITRDYGAAHVLAINLDTWNKLPTDIQEIISQAAVEATSYSSTAEDETMTQNLKTIESSGVNVLYLPMEECQTLYKAYSQIRWDEVIFPTAEKQGILTEAQTLRKYIDQLTWGE